MKEIIDGQVFINGYAVDGMGRPRTMSNGYSSEDENDAHEQYLLAKESQSKSDKFVPPVSKKYTNKSKLSLCDCIQGQVNGKTYMFINDQRWLVEYIDGQKFVGGCATNSHGVPICMEFGYSKEESDESKRLYRQAKYLAQNKNSDKTQLI